MEALIFSTNFNHFLQKNTPSDLAMYNAGVFLMLGIFKADKNPIAFSVLFRMDAINSKS